MSRQFDLVVFDWDGTLMDSTATIALAIQLACEDIGLPVPTLERAKHVIGLGLADALAYAVPELTQADLPAMIERYRVHYLARHQDCVLFPQVRDLLSELRDSGHHVAIATGKNRVGLDRSLSQVDLHASFDATRTADETRSKPDPLMLLELVEHFGVPPERALMIGDTTHDLQMAINADVPALGVAYGAHPHGQLASLKPRAILESSDALRTWLRVNA